MKSLTFRIPAFIAAAVCFTSLLGSTTEAPWWRPVFFAFLPAAFFVNGSLLSKLHRENGRLRRRLSQLEQRVASLPAGGGQPRAEELVKITHDEDI